MEQQNTIEAEKPNEEKPQFRSEPPKLQAFEIIQKYFAFAGITPSLAKQPYPLNASILFGILMLGAAIYFTSVFIIYEAETFAQYTQSVYAVSLVALIALALLIIILKVESLFEYFNKNDILVNTSEYSIYSQLPLLLV